MDLRQAVEMAKRILMKGKIDRQLAGQSSSTLFISRKEGFDKKVTFDMMDGIEQKIDKLTVMMGKLVMEDEGQNRPFKSQIYLSNRGRGQTRCNYDQRRFQNRFRPNNTEDDQGMDKNLEVGQDMILIIIEVATYIIQEVIKRYGRPNNNNNRRGNFRNHNYNRNRSKSYERQNRGRRDGRSASNSR